MSSEHSGHAQAGLDADKLPTHLAVIMDGNGRWARSRLMNRIRGHERGAETVRRVVRTCREVGIRYLTLYAFSTENWQRPKSEITALMSLLKRFLTSEAPEMRANRVRLEVIGQVERLPTGVREAIAGARAATAGGDGMQLTLALSYGGRAEITRMVERISRRIVRGDIDSSDITEEVIAENLYTRGMPDPDLLIRTSGEMRISNFLLWQIAYSEIHVTQTLWPDFGRDELLQILADFQKRERRFGRIGT